MSRLLPATWFDPCRLVPAVLLAVLLGRSAVRADTEVGGYILEDTTWTAADSPYVVVQSIIIGGDATLTIEPGVEGRFRKGLGLTVGDEVQGAGTLVARGTEVAPILFTSNDPYEDPPGVAEPGDWRSIRFTDYAVDAVYDQNGEYLSGSILEHVIVEYAGGRAAAVKTAESSPYLVHCEIRHNAHSGLRVDGADAPPIRVERCYIWDNARAGSGGGVYLGNVQAATLIGNTIVANRATRNGGGICLRACSAATLSGNTIEGNTSENGGGVWAESCSGLTLAGNSVSGNTAAGGDFAHGGGVCLWICGDVTLNGNTITGNRASGDYARGGGVYLYWWDYPTLSDNTITGNSASGDYARGGGVCLDGCVNATLSGNTMTGNRATGEEDARGGGVYLGSCDYATLSDNTITGNAASGSEYASAGGVCLDRCGDATLAWNAIAENTADDNGGAAYVRRGTRVTFRSNRITSNHTVRGQTGGIYVTDGSTYLSLAGDPNTPHLNLIAGNDGYQLYNDNGFDGSGANDIDARWVVWCTDDPNAIDEGIYDFFDDAGRAIVFWEPFFEHIPGDLNDDWTVELDDLATLLSNYGTSSGAEYEDGDLDGDGDVDLDDLAALVSVYRTSCP